MTLLEAALEYALLYRFPVFPCGDFSKKPRAGSHGLKEATLIEIHIRAWWEKWPRANVGIATGSRSFDVLDIDPEHDGYASAERLGIELSGPRASTPRGGMHLYFRGGSLATNAGKVKGLDMRGNGGYVIAPPSERQEGPYEWIQKPIWGEPLLEPPRVLRELAATSSPGTPVTGAPIDIQDPGHRAIIAQADIPLLAIMEGQRDDVLYKRGCSLRAKGLDGPSIRYILGVINSLLCVPPLPEKQVDKLAGQAAKEAMSPAYQKHAERIRQAEERAEGALLAADAAKTRAEARAEKIQAKASEVVARAQAAADEVAGLGALEVRLDAAGANLEALRDIVQDAVGLRVERVIQRGRDAPLYFLELEGGGDPINVGSSLISKDKIAEAIIRQCQHDGLADLPAKRWSAIRKALLALVVVQDDVELDRAGQTRAWIRDFYQAERRKQRLVRDEQTILKRAPFIEEGWIYVNARGLRTHLLSSGVALTDTDVGQRLAEIGERDGSGIVSAATADGQIQARYWRVNITELYLSATTSNDADLRVNPEE